MACSSSRRVYDDGAVNMGLSRAAALIAKYGEVQTSESDSYFKYISDRLKRGSCMSRDPAGNPRIVMVHAVEPLAVSAGGGIIVVSNGLVRKVTDESQFAFVLAHEIAHDCLNHLESDLKKEQRDYEEEVEADSYALGLVAVSGYDPRSAISALVHLYPARFESSQEVTRKELLSRLASLQEKLEKSGWEPPGTVDRRSFQSFRRSLYLR